MARTPEPLVSKKTRLWKTEPPELPYVEWADASRRLAWLIERSLWAVANNMLLVRVPKFRPKTERERLAGIGLLSPADATVIAPPESLLVGPGGNPLSREVPHAATRT